MERLDQTFFFSWAREGKFSSHQLTERLNEPIFTFMFLSILQWDICRGCSFQGSGPSFRWKGMFGGEQVET